MHADNTVKIQPVTVALSASNQVGISNGLQPGDVVVTDGTDKLQEGSKVEPHTATGGTNAQGAQGTQGDATGSPGNQQSTAPYQPPQTQSPSSQQQQVVQPAHKGKRQ